MNKSWSLYKWQQYKDYPSINYFWVDPNGVIRFTRSVEPIGYLPAADMSNFVELDLSFLKKYLINQKVAKVKTKKMTEEQLSQGMLIL
jgi:hypothetical protein